MKSIGNITVNGRDFAKAMKAAMTVNEFNPRIPILRCVRLCMVRPGLRIFATDLDMEIMVPLDLIEAEGKFDVCIPAALLAKIAAQAGASSIAMLHEEVANGKDDEGKPRTKQQITVIVGDEEAEYVLDCLPSSDWPEMTQPEKLSSAGTFTNGQLSEIFAEVIKTVSTEETRYYLNGIHYKGGMCEATDGHRLRRHVFDKAPMHGHDVIIPRKACRVIIDQGKDGVTLEVDQTGNRMLISFSNGNRLFSKMIDGSFPDTERVIPKEGQFTFDFDAARFRLAVERVISMSSERGRALKIFNHEGKACVKVSNPDFGSATAQTFAEWPIGGEEVGFNGRYILDFIPKGGRIQINGSGSGAPFLIRHVNGVDDDSANTRVVMPMRV